MSESESQRELDRKFEEAMDAAAPWGAEDKRLREIRNKRRAAGACIMCGKPMGWFDKRAGREQHDKCTRFTEDPSKS